MLVIKKGDSHGGQDRLSPFFMSRDKQPNMLIVIGGQEGQKTGQEGRSVSYCRQPQRKDKKAA